MSENKAKRFGVRLAIILAAGLAARFAYVAAQARYDPAFSRPLLDGAYYVDEAKALLAGRLPDGAFYMPPLYPFLLAGFLRVAGEAWGVLYAAQQALVVLGAGLLAVAARKAAGDRAGYAAAVIALAYHPGVYFASRPLGEPLALMLLAAAVVLAGRDDPPSGLGSGVAAGLAILARPNLLPLPVVWAAAEALRGRGRRAAMLALGMLLAVAPVAVRNHAVSGHWVPVSANGGVVFWLGNAPGAVGLYTPGPPFSGALDTQRAEAVDEARARSGRSLDAVEADAYWGRAGLRARLADPAGTGALLVRRAALTVDNAEHGLDYAPALDGNPWRWASPLPFAVVFALAIFALASRGYARTGGDAVWLAVVVAAAAPLLFYVSSRHRLPIAFLLAIPAGAGLVALGTERRASRWAAGLAALAVSVAVPSGGLVRSERAAALTSLADVYRRGGEPALAEQAARSATEIDPTNAVAWFNYGVVLRAEGRDAEAEKAYREALRADPSQPDAAANLAGLLVAGGRPAEAIPSLETALAAWPRHAVGWTNLVVAYAAAGEGDRAREAAERARARGVALDPELVQSVGGGGHR